MFVIIKQIYDENFFSERKCDNFYQKKIKSLVKAYGFSYDFCKLYSDENEEAILLHFNDSVVISGKFNYDELNSFLSIISPSTIETDDLLFEHDSSRYEKVHRTLMKCVPAKHNIDELLVEKNCNLKQAYEIISDGFPEIEFDMFYVDLSHKIRHNVTDIFVYNNMVSVTKEFSDDKFAFLSTISTRKAHRGKGYARNFLYYLADELGKHSSEVFLYAKDERVSFYKEIGFIPTKSDYIYYRK